MMALYTHLAALAFGAAIAFGSAWKVQENRFQHQISGMQVAAAKEKADRQDALLKAVETARLAEQALSTKYQGALNEARARELAERNSAAAARAESERLRGQAADAARRLAAAPPAAVLDYALAVNAVFDDCRAAYEEMGSYAAGHAADARTLREAWPVATDKRP